MSQETTTQPRREVKCYNCQKTGHIARNCSEERSKESDGVEKKNSKDKKPSKRTEKKSKRGKEKAALAEASGEDEDSDESAYIAVDEGENIYELAYIAIDSKGNVLDYPESDQEPYLVIDENGSVVSEDSYEDLCDLHAETKNLDDLSDLQPENLNDLCDLQSDIDLSDLSEAFVYTEYPVDDEKADLNETEMTEDRNVDALETDLDDGKLANSEDVADVFWNWITVIIKEAEGLDLPEKKSRPIRKVRISPSGYVESGEIHHALITQMDPPRSETAYSTVPEDKEIPWTIDSGATRHMCVRRNAFRSFEAKKTRVMVGGKGSLSSPGRGDVMVEMNNKNRVIRDVLWVPDLGFNLISISALEDKGLRIAFSDRKVRIMRGNRVIAVGHRHKNLYLLAKVHQNTALVTGAEPLESATPVDPSPEGNVDGKNENKPKSDGDKITKAQMNRDELFQTLHTRLGHPSTARLCAMEKTVFGIPKLAAPKDFYCDVCENNKLTRRIRRFRYEKETEPGSRLFCDVWGPYRVRTPIPGLEPYKYYLSIVDEATGTSFLLPLTTRAAVISKMTAVVNIIDRKEGGVTIRFVRCDNAREFLALEPAIKQRGITMEYTTVYTLEQNGVAERFNRTIITMVRCMIHQAKFPDGFWPYAAMYANWLR